MMKIALLSALLMTAGIAFAPVASAECEPLADPDFCPSRLDPVKDTIERIQDMECYYYPSTHQIRCYY